jgi:dihydrofolate synthase/folylpolyglutamate synthase
MDYIKARDWLYARQAIGIKLGLANMENLTAKSGHPERRFRSIHIAGTNGKGSVARYLAAMLSNAGYRTGLYTSPHLVRFTERIEIDGEPVAESAVAAGLTELRPIVEQMDQQGAQCTFFEIATMLAFQQFAEADVEWAVIETGLGGRLDATNVLSPEATIVTNISVDHQAELGTSDAEVAFEKAGIMKPGVPCITGATDDALIILKARSQELQCPMSIVGVDYQVLPRINGFRLAHPGGDAEYNLRAAGAHQIQNAALAIATVDALRKLGVTLPMHTVSQVLAETEFAGRLETFFVDTDEGSAEILLDGAHNVAGMEALRFHLGRIDWAGFVWIAGFGVDKDWSAMLEQCMPLAARVIGVPLRSPRGTDPEALRTRVERAGFPFSVATDFDDALAQARAAGATRILVAGSLFLVGEARARLTQESLEEFHRAQ